MQYGPHGRISSFLICHLVDLDRSEIDLNQQRSECERSNANWDRSEFDLNECVSQSKLRSIWDRSMLDQSCSVNGLLLCAQTYLQENVGCLTLHLKFVAAVSLRLYRFVVPAPDYTIWVPWATNLIVLLMIKTNVFYRLLRIHRHLDYNVFAFVPIQ